MMICKVEIHLITVEPHLTCTLLIWSPLHYGHFFWPCGNTTDSLTMLTAEGKQRWFIILLLLFQYFINKPVCFKEDSAGFAQVFLECPLEIAMQRNSSRSHPVSSQTMMTMSSKMEPPDPEKFPWEQHYLTLKTEEELNAETMYVSNSKIDWTVRITWELPWLELSVMKGKDITFKYTVNVTLLLQLSFCVLADSL